MRKVKLLLVVCITLLLLNFAAVNRDFIDISLFPLGYTLEVPKFLLAIVCFGAGVIAGGLVMSLKLNRALRIAKKEHKLVRALQNEMDGFKQENSSLRTTLVSQHEAA